MVVHATCLHSSRDVWWGVNHAQQFGELSSDHHQVAFGSPSLCCHGLHISRAATRGRAVLLLPRTQHQRHETPQPLHYHTCNSSQRSQPTVAASPVHRPPTAPATMLFGRAKPRVAVVRAAGTIAAMARGRGKISMQKMEKPVRCAAAVPPSPQRCTGCRGTDVGFCCDAYS